MVLLNTHPDYTIFNGKKLGFDEYHAHYYEEYLNWLKDKCYGQYLHKLLKEITELLRSTLNITT